MRSFPENFECLILGEAHFGVPKIVGRTITIPVMHLPVHAYGRHPFCAVFPDAVRKNRWSPTSVVCTEET
jgi:hypothetical protein